MIKAIGRAALITLIIGLLFFLVWKYILVTLLSKNDTILHITQYGMAIILLVIFCWFSIMFRLDPPEDWN